MVTREIWAKDSLLLGALTRSCFGKNNMAKIAYNTLIKFQTQKILTILSMNLVIQFANCVLVCQLVEVTYFH